MNFAEAGFEMRVFCAVLVARIVLFHDPAWATTVEGDVWGEWTVEGSPYEVVAEVRVPPDSTLTIYPGVIVIFEGHYRFLAENSATLLAVGTESDSIVFTAMDTTAGWGGIRFLTSDSNSQLRYCRLEYGRATGWGANSFGGAILCSNSSPSIMNNFIRWNTASSGGGIACFFFAHPTISENIISENRTDYDGGGISCDFFSAPTLNNNTIQDNSSCVGGGISSHSYSIPIIRGNFIADNSANCDGGGIFCDQSAPIINLNTITGNSAQFYGGGISCEDSSDPEINGNLISGNWAANEGGGGIACTNNSNPEIENNAIIYNQTYEYGGGIFCWASDPAITENTIQENWGVGGGIFCYQNASPLISDNEIRNNSSHLDGGGIYCYDEASPTIRENIVSGNNAGYWGDGGGICLKFSSDPLINGNLIIGNSAASLGNGGGISISFSSDPTIEQNTISGNVAYYSGGGVSCVDSSNPIITNTILWADTSSDSSEIFTEASEPVVRYSDIQGSWPGEGNIDSDPLFVDPEGGMYDLQPGSSCIDSADPDSPSIPWGGWVRDMGALEYDQGFYFDGQNTIRKPFPVQVLQAR